jgi:hypothetical protein
MSSEHPIFHSKQNLQHYQNTSSPDIPEQTEPPTLPEHQFTRYSTANRTSNTTSTPVHPIFHSKQNLQHYQNTS